jgi:hypothetical protein
MVCGSNTRQVSSAADRLEDFVRSNRSRSKDALAERAERSISMTASNVAPDDAELLLLASSSSSSSSSAAISITRQKKALSSPDVFLPRSLSQLEETVRVASSWATHDTPLPHTPLPHTPLPHTPLPHTPLPHTPLPHTPLPHTPLPHTPLPHTRCCRSPRLPTPNCSATLRSTCR